MYQFFRYRSARRPLRASALLALLLLGLVGLRPPPAALAACGGSVTAVANESQLNAAIAEFNSLDTDCDFTIELGVDIALTASTPTIDNATPGVSLTIQGGGFAIDGQDTAGIRPLTVAADTVVVVRQVLITRGNMWDNGGGIHNSGRLTITDSDISLNKSTAPDLIALRGGGIFNQGNLSLIRSTVSTNRVQTNNNAGYGGGIANRGYLLIRDSSIIDNNVVAPNASGRGGGIFADQFIDAGPGSAGITIINSTISGNYAAGGEIARGGGLYVEYQQSFPVSLVLINSTATNNSTTTDAVTTGSGVYLSGNGNPNLSVTIHNSILAGNNTGATAGEDCRLAGAPTFTSRHSLYGNSGTSACGLAAPVTNPDTDGNYVGVDPKLGPLADNGGPTLTHLPADDSPAVNAGSNDLAVDENGDDLTTDQRGYLLRAMNGKVDMGAVEVGATVCPTFPANAGDEDALNVAIYCYNAISTPGSYTINLTAEIDLTASTTTINNTTPGVSLTIEGGGFAIDGQGTEGVRPLTVAADTDVTLRQITITGGLIKGNSIHGGGIHNSGRMTITDSRISGNTIIGGVDTSGGGIYNNGNLTLVRSTVDGNLIDTHNDVFGGGIANFGQLLIRDSSITNNVLDVFANAYGGGIFHGGMSSTYADVVALTIINSTISGNEIEGIQEALEGAGLYAADLTCCSTLPYVVEVVLINTTITNNSFSTSSFTTTIGSGATFKANDPDTGLSVTIYNSILAGNITNNPDDLFGEDCVRSTQGYLTFTSFSSLYGDSGEDACGLAAANPDGNGNRVGVDARLGPLADNGGPTLTHLPADDSPAVNTGADDFAVDENGYPLDNDQRGDGFTRRQGSSVDMGAVETDIKGVAIYLSAATSGTTADGQTFDNSDILKWDGQVWSLAFDGSAALLAPNNKSKHNVNAFWMGDGEIIMSFAQQGRKVPGISAKVDGTDLVRWDGSAFSLWFDGSDVGLEKKTPEKIDGLHVLPGSEAPPEYGGGCVAYLLVSTQGPGMVPAYGGGQIKFSGEDVLGFCATNLGDNTAGFWHLALDGSAEGVKKNAVDSISLSADGQTLYLTTKAKFKVDTANGTHSSVYAFDLTTGTFSGPIFVAADNGLPKKVDGLQMN